MKDYSECLINVREFLRRAEDCFNAKNPVGASHHVMNAIHDTKDLFDFAIVQTSEKNDVEVIVCI